jgi:hypothetical protein
MQASPRVGGCGSFAWIHLAGHCMKPLSLFTGTQRRTGKGDCERGGTKRRWYLLGQQRRWPARAHAPKRPNSPACIA